MPTNLMTTPTHNPIPAPKPTTAPNTPTPGQPPTSTGERTASAACVDGARAHGARAHGSQEHSDTQGGTPSYPAQSQVQGQGVFLGGAPVAVASSYVWTPLHTPALARLIFADPATSHLPPAALTDLLHTAGHDLAVRARDYLIRRLTPAQTQDFLAVHDPVDPGPGTAWIQDHVPGQGSLLAGLTAGILDDITAGPYQYLNTHHAQD